MVPEHVNEERLRIFEAQVPPTSQSVYDTYIQYTRMEANDPRLSKLRSYVSMALHLLEIATVLVHFHERHELHYVILKFTASCKYHRNLPDP